MKHIRKFSFVLFMLFTLIALYGVFNSIEEKKERKKTESTEKRLASKNPTALPKYMLAVEDEEPDFKIKQVAVKSLTVREKPTVNSKKIETVYIGEKVRVYKSVNDFDSIKVVNKNITGYVMNKYLTEKMLTTRIAKVNARPLDSVGEYTLYSWIVEIENPNDTPEMRTLKVTFMDKSGFVLATDYVFNVLLRPHSVKTISNTKYVIDGENAKRISAELE